MEGSERLRLLVINAVVAALGLTLPLAFHSVGLGSQFLPMLLPLLLNGFFSPISWAVCTGAAVPLASALLTGMPPLYPPMALVVSAEGVVLGGVAALVYHVSQRRVWPTLVTAILCGKVAAMALTWGLAQHFDLPPALASTASVMQGLPGVVLQLAVVPPVIRVVSKRNSLLFRHEC